MKRIVKTLSFDRNLKNSVCPMPVGIIPFSCDALSRIKLSQIFSLPKSGKLPSSILGISGFFPRLRRDVRISWPFPMM